MGHQTVILRSRMRRHQRPKRVDSSSDRLFQSIFTTSSTLTDIDLEYLAAAENGDLAAVTRCILDYNANINCLDSLGRCALELALMGDHQAIVEYLLPRSNIQGIEDALLYAIGKDNVKMAEIILDHPLFRSTRVQLHNSDGFFQRESQSPRMRPNTTPLALAAQRDNFYIVQLLISRGARIAPPHDYFCDCIECTNQKMFDSVKYSRSRLNTFKALASPAYISLSSEDPIHAAFHLSHQLEELAEIEKEYKSEYRKLSNQCKDFSVELLDLCQSTDEIMAILCEDGQHSSEEQPEPVSTNFSLARVKMAIKYEQKRFIAHATSQRQLISLWYAGATFMRHQKTSLKLLAVPLASLLLPFSTLIFLCAPTSKFATVMRSPFIKFLHHTCAYVGFLVLVFMACLRGGSGMPWLDMACFGVMENPRDSLVFILILIWVMGMFLHECRQLWREGPKNYITDWWNWMDSSLIILYLAYYAIQLVIFAKVSAADAILKPMLCPNMSLTMSCRQMQCEVDRALLNVTHCNMNSDCSGIDDLYSPRAYDEVLDILATMHQISDIFFSLANVLSFARIAHLLPANEQLGPLLVSFGRMLHDVTRFGVVFALVFLAFLCGLTSLYRTHECENKHFSRWDLTLSSLFWATFGMGDTKSTLIDSRYLASSKNLIHSHSMHHALTVIFGYCLFWSYIAGAVVVLLNMLIAMMSNSFQEIYDDRDVEWKFARAKLWIDFFEDGCTLPSPFNLIPNPKYLWIFFKYLKHKCKKEREEPPVQMAYIYTRRKNGMIHEDISNVEMPKKPETKYKGMIRRLVQRYVYKEQTEILEKRQNENESIEMRQDVCNLAVSIDKLRLEMAQIRSSIAHGLKVNGINNRSRTEMQV